MANLAPATRPAAALLSLALLSGCVRIFPSRPPAANQPPTNEPPRACTEIGCSDTVKVTVPEALPQALTLTLNGQVMDFCNPGPNEKAEWNFQGLVGQYTFADNWRKDVAVQITGDATLITFNPVWAEGGRPMDNLSLSIATRPNCLVAVMPTVRYTVNQPLSYAAFQPNGPGCEPICRSAEVTPTRAK